MNEDKDDEEEQEEEPAKEKTTKETPTTTISALPASRMSKEINTSLALDIDWTKLSEKDLRKLHVILTNKRQLRKLLLRAAVHKALRREKDVKRKLREMAQDFIEESSIVEKLGDLIYGDDED